MTKAVIIIIIIIITSIIRNIFYKYVTKGAIFL
jgi:hypothetical protein